MLRTHMACVSLHAATGHDPALLQRANTTAELHAYLAAPPGSPGRPMVVLTTLQVTCAQGVLRSSRIKGG